MAHRYFISELCGRQAVVSGDEARHLIKVMRIKPGRQLLLTYKDGYDYTATADRIEDGQVIFTVLSKQKNPADPQKKLTVFMALPKSDKLEFITQKCCELGASVLVPFVSEYCVAQKSKKDEAKTRRLQRISDRACKQCGRSVPMQVELAGTFAQLLGRIKDYDKCLFFYENGGVSMNKTDLSACTNAAVIIGSEGGFSQKEADLITRRGAQTVSLGSRILRCETAALTACTLAMYNMGEME